jgi:hypothetical protein
LRIKVLFHFKKRKDFGKKVGVIGVRNDVNIGNNLVKYAMSIKLKELGYIPYIIGTHWKNFNITFINQTTNLVIIHNNFSEINKDDYDILMVNSDQTWRKFDEHSYDYAFLKFAQNWNINKFIYGASLGYDEWMLSSKDDEIAKKLLKNFSGISIREEGSKKLIEQHFGINPLSVLDPTLLIDKKYFLDIIKDYHGRKKMNKKYIFIYTTFYSKYVVKAMKNASKILDYEVYYLLLNNQSSVQDFIYYMFNSNAVITNAFHGTIFSIIFNKPFITIYDKTNAKERFNSLANLFGIHERFYENNQRIDFEQLRKPLNLNNNLLIISSKTIWRNSKVYDTIKGKILIIPSSHLYRPFHLYLINFKKTHVYFYLHKYTKKLI